MRTWVHWYTGKGPSGIKDDLHSAETRDIIPVDNDVKIPISPIGSVDDSCTVRDIFASCVYDTEPHPGLLFPDIPDILRFRLDLPDHENRNFRHSCKGHEVE